MSWVYRQPMGSLEELLRDGPVVLGTLIPSEFTRSEEWMHGQPRHPRVVRMLVDTGAGPSMIEQSVAEELGLSATRFVQVVGISQAVVACPVYHAEIEVGFERSTRGGKKESCVMAIPVTLAGMPPPFTQLSHVGLLGRDFLQHFQVAYDGPGGEFALRTTETWPRRTRPVTGQHMQAAVRVTPREARALADALLRYADTHRDTEHP
jgi:hypothetical protein